MKKIVNGVSLN